MCKLEIIAECARLSATRLGILAMSRQFSASPFVLFNSALKYPLFWPLTGPIPQSRIIVNDLGTLITCTDRRTIPIAIYHHSGNSWGGFLWRFVSSYSLAISSWLVLLDTVRRISTCLSTGQMNRKAIGIVNSVTNWEHRLIDKGNLPPISAGLQVPVTR